MTEIERIKINTSIPVNILELPNSNFNQEHQNDFVTHAKLKIFYVGETADGRLFTEDFSEKILKTLPQSPVVGYYDENEDDFKAHNYKQYVYGYVPETAKVEFDEEDDKVWAYTDVILFTGRKDNIGEVASKIIGMQHSLELDPDSVQYKINRDENGKFKNIEFTDGKFIGLSVVGNSEKPAFTGSHFFTVENEDEMIKAFKNFQNDINAFFAKNNNDESDNDKSKNGGVEMDNLTEQNVQTQEENFVEENVVEENLTPESTPEEPENTEETTTTFMKTPYDEVEQAVMKQFRQAFGDYAYVVQWSSVDDMIVYWSGEDNNYYRVEFTMNEENEILEFGEKMLVKPRYLTEEEIEAIFTEGEGAGKTETEPEVETQTVVATEATAVQEEQGEQDGETQETQKGLLLTESEAEQLEKDMAELQEFRKKEKELMIEDFKDLISKEDYEAIKGLVDNFSKEDLEIKLSLALTKKIKSEKNGTSEFSAVKIYDQNQNDNQTNQNPVQDLINRWKDKK